MGDPEEDMDGGDEQVDMTIPELWRYVSPQGPDGAPGQGPLVGKIVNFLNKKEEEELAEEIIRRNPETGQSLLMWAVLQQKFVLVEWLLKKCKRAAFAFSDAEKELTIFDKFVEKRKEREQEEKERLEALAEGGDEEEEEREPPPPIHEVVKGDLGEEEGIDEFKVRCVGEVGVYQGTRSANRTKTGLGQTLFVNGDCYIGEYQDNKRHGIGCYWWAESGEIYVGEWSNNKRSGQGRMVYANGGRYYGRWRLNDRVGKGRFTYPSGDVYSGDWERGVRHGQGTYTVAQDRSLFIGTFADGDFVTGEWRLAGGVRFYGVFENFKPVGKGVFFHKFGQEGAYTQDGEYVDGVWQPSVVRRPTDAAACIDISVQGKILTLRCAPTTNLDTLALVQVVNFKPLEEWFAKLADPDALARGFTIKEVEVRAVQWEAHPTRTVKSVTIGVKAIDREGVPYAHLGHPDPDTLTFTKKTSLLVPIVRCDDKERLLYVTTPNLALADLQAPELMTVQQLPSGDLASPEITALKGIGLDLHSGSIIDASKLCPANDGEGTRTHPIECDAQHNVFYFLQDVTPEYWKSLEQRLAEANGAKRGFESLTFTDDPAAFTALTQSVPSIAAMHLVTALRGGKLPASTWEPMRPPTPPAPVAEPRPDVPKPPPEDIPPPKEEPAEEED